MPLKHDVSNVDSKILGSFSFNKSKPKHNGRQFEDGIFKLIYLMEN